MLGSSGHGKDRFNFQAARGVDACCVIMSRTSICGESGQVSEICVAWVHLIPASYTVWEAIGVRCVREARIKTAKCNPFVGAY